MCVCVCVKRGETGGGGGGREVCGRRGGLTDKTSPNDGNARIVLLISFFFIDAGTCCNCKKNII